MRAHVKLAFLIALAGLAAGCMSEDYRRADGLTQGPGEAMAANTVMQMVDPWQDGVQNTQLLVPADRGAVEEADSGAGDARQSQTQSGN